MNTCQWTLVFLREREKKKDRMMRFLTTPSSRSPSVSDMAKYLGISGPDGQPLTPGRLLWGLLRKTYHLRVLRLRQEAIEALRADVERQKAELLRAQEEEHLCIICFDSVPNTVRGAWRAWMVWTVCA